MTDQEINTEIAIACGWKMVTRKSTRKCYEDYVRRGWLHRPEWDGIPFSCDSTPVPPPDYTNDLNAMHEAEKTLGGPTDYRWSGYCTFLLDVCGGMGSRLHATARQRAEALLKTIGKWKP